MKNLDSKEISINKALASYNKGSAGVVRCYESVLDGYYTTDNRHTHYLQFMLDRMQVMTPVLAKKARVLVLKHAPLSVAFDAESGLCIVKNVKPTSNKKKLLLKKGFYSFKSERFKSLMSTSLEVEKPVDTSDTGKARKKMEDRVKAKAAVVKALGKALESGMTDGELRQLLANAYLASKAA